MKRINIRYRWILAISILAVGVVGYLIGPRISRIVLAAGDTYYVDINGSDSDPGSATQPWRTIQHAANTLKPGDTAIVRAGDYDERVTISRSGSASARITFRAEGAVSLQTFFVYADYITLHGFQVTNHTPSTSQGNGIRLIGDYGLLEDIYAYDNAFDGIHVDGHANTVRNCRAYRNELRGINVLGTDNLIENNEIWGSVQHHPAWGGNPPGGADADGITFFGSGHVFRGNYIHSISYDDPLVVDAHIDAFSSWGGASDILFEGNRIHLPYEQTANEKAVGWMLRDTSNLTIRNNVLDVHTGVNTSPGNNSGLTFHHNTLVSRPDFAHWSVGFIFPANADVRNNIFIDFYQAFHGADGDDTIAGNAAWNSDGTAPRGSGDFWGLNPLFADFAAGNYHLQANSPLIDAVPALSSVSLDHDGIARPQGANADVGAYEYVSDSQSTPEPSPTYTPTSPPPTPTPSPSTPELVVDDTDPGFSTSSSGDAWQAYTQTNGQHYGDTHHFNSQIGTGNDIATWAFQVPQPGVYQVYAWWWAGGWRPSDVPYTVHHDDGATTVRMNQQINGGQWNLVGTYTFRDSGAVSLSDDVSGGQDIVADAVKLVWVEAPPDPTPTPIPPTSTPTYTPTPVPFTPTPMPTATATPTSIPDDIVLDDAGDAFQAYATRDTWVIHTQNGGQHHNGSHHYNEQVGTGSDIATWSFQVPTAGVYEVYAWWWKGSWRPVDVPYTIDHAAGSTTIRMNQQIDGGQWNLVGTFAFQDNGAVTVSDDVSSGRDIVADAIRLVYRGPLSPQSDHIVLKRLKAPRLNEDQDTKHPFRTGKYRDERSFEP